MGQPDQQEPQQSQPPVVLVLSEYARRTVENIGRTGETAAEVINRILEALYPSSPDFDMFYGEPRDGRGPSGK
ncbi:MAG TPA: hypothetical protein VFS21_37000 [Roseiflexaceae bacterium]|nr:hypothetical protein [Roseiflexaceae bacterium]